MERGTASRAREERREIGLENNCDGREEEHTISKAVHYKGEKEREYKGFGFGVVSEIGDYKSASGIGDAKLWVLATEKSTNREKRKYPARRRRGRPI